MKKCIFTAVLSLICLLSVADATRAGKLWIPEPAKLDSFLDRYVEGGGYPFLYARIEDKNGRLVYEHSSVNKQLLPDSKIDGDTWMRIWSMSKIVTIATVLDLVEEGLLSLDEPVVKYIPEFKNLKVAVSNEGADLSVLEEDARKNACPLKLEPVKKEMTVRHLINHQAGFYYATTGIPCIDNMVAEKNLTGASNSRQLVKRLAELPLIQQPGTNDYYGTNTTVLGIVGERASGKSLKMLVEERVTGPLKLEGVRYGTPRGVTLLPKFSGRDKKIRLATDGELDIFGGGFPFYESGSELYLGGEGMLATADGYADFLRMLLNRGTLNGHRLLERKTVKEMTSPQSQLDSEYGYNGYNIWVNNGKKFGGGKGEGGLWIGGGYEGTYYWIDPKREFVAVIMTQMFWIQPEFYGRDDGFREAVYEQLRKAAAVKK